MKLEYSRQMCEKYIKFRDSPFSGSRVVLYGQADTTKPTAAFRNFANAPKMNTTITISVES